VGREGCAVRWMEMIGSHGCILLFVAKIAWMWDDNGPTTEMGWGTGGGKG
jgi:hypothetical protein